MIYAHGLISWSFEVNDFENELHILTYEEKFKNLGKSLLSKGCKWYKNVDVKMFPDIRLRKDRILNYITLINFSCLNFFIPFIALNPVNLTFLEKLSFIEVYWILRFIRIIYWCYPVVHLPSVCLMIVFVTLKSLLRSCPDLYWFYKCDFFNGYRAKI